MLRKTCLALAALGLTTVAAAPPQWAVARTGVARTSPPVRAPERPPLTAVAVIRDAEGKVLGTFQVEPYDTRKVRIAVSVRGLTPGFHGFHIHSAGVCDPQSIDKATGSPFASAGGHFNLRKSHFPATGDLPPLLAASDGTAEMSFVLDRFRIRQLRDRDGSAIVVHAKPDNFANIPDRYTHPKDHTGTTGPDATTLATGDAGRRVGCGVIEVV